MATDNNIKIFTAADIEKYHKGMLTPAQMHFLEKAALDDPFLADALEGYAVAGVNTNIDLAELKKRLSEKTVGVKIISINQGNRTKFAWIKVAAAIVIIGSAVLVANQFLFTKKYNDRIAQAETAKKDEIKIIDSSASSVVPVSADTNTKGTPPASTGVQSNKKTAADNVIKETNGSGTAAKKEVTVIVTNQPPVVKELAVNETSKQEIKTAGSAKKYQKQVAAQEEKDKDVAAGQAVLSEDGLKKNRSVSSGRKADEQSRNFISNTFRGLITDADNIGVPFANVTNPQDNVGTYSDARGYFNLTYPDTVLNVQVRSIGFENNNVQLRNNIPTNKVVLQDDRSLSEIVINSQKPNAAARSRESNIKLVESEPTDGWNNYDSYLANNLKAPEDFKNKQVNKTEVAVSFEVDKMGDPTNFKIEKSLCATCDKEAIRLIKEGPKWKRPAGKKARTKVIINF